MNDKAGRQVAGGPAGLLFLLDRIVVLFLGVGVGLAIGFAFLGQASAPKPPHASPAPASAPAAQGGRVAAAPIAAPPATPIATPPLDCAAPYPPRLLARLRTGAPVTIGVFGDSFGDGVWAALYRRMGKDNAQVLRLSHEGVGFVRYQTTNLEQQATQDLAGKPVDVGVVMIGANDTQGIFENGHGYAFLSPGWKAIYGGRMDRFVAVVRKSGAMVYWLGLPKMRRPAYDQDVENLNAYVAEHMAALGVPYISTKSLSVDPQGEFNLYLPVPGADGPRLMRANDGIHMTMDGYERLAGPVIDRIHGYLARAKAQAGAEPAAEGGT